MSTIYFSGSGSNTLEVNNASIENLSISGAGTLTLQDDLACSQEFQARSGSFDANDNNVSANIFSLMDSSISMGASGWHITSDNGKWLENNYTVLLLHMNGVNGGQVFIDETGKRVSAEGTAQTLTAQKKFGVSSAGSFSGSGNQIIVPNSIDWTLDGASGAPFTIDFWIRPTGDTTTQFLMCRPSEDYTYYWDLFINTAINFRHDDIFSMSCPITAISANEWNHIALVRVDNSNSVSGWRIFVNGISQTLTKGSGNWNESIVDTDGILYIGANPVGYPSNPFLGYIDEVRISKGIARWTENFELPTTEWGTKIVKESSIIKFICSNIGTFKSNNQYNDLWVTGSTEALYIEGSNIFNVLRINENKQLQCSLSSVQGVNNLIASGSTGNLISMMGYNPGEGWSITSATGNIYCDFLDLNYSTATGGANFFTGLFSVDSFKNYGWLWPWLNIRSVSSNEQGDISDTLSSGTAWWNGSTWNSTGELAQVGYTFVVNNEIVTPLSAVSWSSSNTALATVNSEGLVQKTGYGGYGSQVPVIISVWSVDNPIYFDSVCFNQTYPT